MVFPIEHIGGDGGDAEEPRSKGRPPGPKNEEERRVQGPKHQGRHGVDTQHPPADGVVPGPGPVGVPRQAGEAPQKGQGQSGDQQQNRHFVIIESSSVVLMNRPPARQINRTAGRPIAPFQLTTVSVPALTTAAEVRVLNNLALTSLQLGALVSVSGTVNIQANSALTAVDVSSLHDVDVCNVQSNPVLLSLSMAALVSVPTSLAVRNNVSLVTLALPLLQDVGDLLIVGNTQLSQCEGTAIVGVGDCAD